MGLGQIALIAVAGLAGPVLAFLTRGVIPAVVATLLLGVVLGTTGFGVIHAGRADLSLLYDLGFTTLMFTVGMHVPLHDRRLWGALRSGGIALAATIPLALLAGLAAHAAGGGPGLVYAVILGSSSAAIALPVIEENRLAGAAVLTAMTWITLADVVATLAIPLAIRPSRAAHAALGALIVAGLVAVTFLVARGLSAISWVHDLRKTGKRRDWAIDLRAAIAVLFSLAYVAEKVGASLLIAGFGTGLVVGAIGGPKRLSREVLGLSQGFLVPVFFVLLGAKLDLRALGRGHGVIVLAVLLAALAIVVHVAVSAAIRTPVAVGLLATAQIGVPAAVIALGLPARAINQGQASAIFCGALVSIAACTAGAAILRRRPGPSGERGEQPGIVADHPGDADLGQRPQPGQVVDRPHV